MRKILACVFALTLAMSLVACGNTQENNDNDVKEEKGKTVNGIGYEEITQNESGEEVARKQLNPIVEMRPDKNKKYDIEKITATIEEQIEKENPGVSEFVIAQKTLEAGYTSAIQMGQMVVSEFGEDFVFNEVDYPGVYLYVYYHDNDFSILENAKSYKELVETAYSDERVYNLVKYAYENYED